MTRIRRLFLAASLLLAALCLLPSPAAAQSYQRIWGYCAAQGTGALAISSSCTVNVYNAGTLTPATVYSDATGTPLSLPFAATSQGVWAFYYNPAAAQNYDVRLSGGVPALIPYTIPNVAFLNTGGGGGGVPGGTSGQIQYNNAGLFGGLSTTGTGLVALQTSPTFITPTLGVAAATSLTAANVTDSALSSGNCVQAGASGLLTTVAGACNIGGGQPCTTIATSLQYNTSGNFGCVAGSAVASSGAVTLTASADNAVPLTALGHSATQTADIIKASADGTTPDCSTILGSPAAVCEGSNGDLSFAHVSIGPATSAFGEVWAMALTGGTATETFSLSKFQGATTESGGTELSNTYGALGSYITLNDDYSIGLYSNNGDGNCWIWWGVSGVSTYSGGIDPCNGNLQIGKASSGQQGQLSMLDGALAHFAHITNPGTLAGDYNFALPVAPGTSGQYLTSAGGGTSPMTWTTPPTPIGTSTNPYTDLYVGTSSSAETHLTSLASTVKSIVFPDIAGTVCLTSTCTGSAGLADPGANGIVVRTALNTTSALTTDTTTTHALFATATATAPAFRAIVAGDIPTLNQNTTGSAAKWTTARNLAGNSVDGSTNVQFANKFIVQGTSDSGLSGPQFLGALATGILKNTTTTGVLSAAASADVISLWTGTCNATTYLRADGTCNSSVGGTITIANGTVALGTSAIASGTCASAVVVTASGVLTTDNIEADFNSDPTSTTGYLPSTNGALTIYKFPTAGNVNFKVCNLTQASVTPGSITLNWRVVR